jgi:hypothetical protein
MLIIEDLVVGLRIRLLLSCYLVGCDTGIDATITVSGRYTASFRFVISRLHDLPVLAASLESLIGSAHVA